MVMIRPDDENFAEEMLIAGLEAFEVDDGIYDMLAKVARSLIRVSNRLARIEQYIKDV